MLMKAASKLLAFKSRLFAPASTDSILSGFRKTVAQLDRHAAYQDALAMRFNLEADEAERKSAEAFVEAARAAAVKKRLEALLG